MKKPLIWALGSLVVGAGVVYAIVASAPLAKPDTTTVKMASTSTVIPAEIYVVKDTTIRENIRLTGSIVPNEEVLIVSETPKRLVKVHFQEGAFVRKGQLLFQLDDADLRANLKRLQAQRKLLVNDEARTAALLKLEGVSKQEYERALGSVETIDAEMELIQVEIAKTQIRAPFTGKTGIRRVSEGAFITQNTPLVNLEDVRQVKLEFAVPEKYANGVRLNQNLTFRVENSDQSFTARTSVIEPKIDQNTRSLFIRAIADNADQLLIPGSSATVELALNEVANTFLIPSQALVPSLEGNSVLCVRNGKVKTTPVTVGLRTNQRVQVTNGLAAGDTVMVTNILRAKEGASVQSTRVLP